MTDPLLLSLRFRPQRQSISPSQVAAVFEDLESLYFAVPRAFAAHEPVQRHLAFEQRARMESLMGNSGTLLSEIEYRTRALRQLEIAGAPEDALRFLRSSIDVLAQSELQRTLLINAPDRDPSESRLRPLELRRMSMQSPLELLVSIPPEYWLGPALVTFLAAIERRFNMVGRIRTEQKTLQAAQAKAEAEEREAEAREREAELRIAQTERTIRALAARETQEEDEGAGEILEGLVPGQNQFELEEGTIEFDFPRRNRSTGKVRNREEHEL